MNKNYIITEIQKLTEVKRQLRYIITHPQRDIILDPIIIQYVIKANQDVQETIYRLTVLLDRDSLAGLEPYCLQLTSNITEIEKYSLNLYNLFL